MSLFFPLLLVACRPPDMYNQPKYKSYSPSAFFSDERSARPPVPNTMHHSRETNPAWREAHLDPARDAPPFGISLQALQRGRERYEIHCVPCHGWTGKGNGMIVQRGYMQPPSFHDPLIRSRTMAHYVAVISSGLGAMPPYAAQIDLHDRWLIAIHLRVLQSSQEVPVQSLPDEIRQRLEGAHP